MVYQKININDSNNIFYDFCYYVEVQSSNGEKVSVVDDANNTLGVDYVTEGVSYYCTDIVSNFVNTEAVIGLRCDTCNSSDIVIIQEELVGDSIEQIYFDSDTSITSVVIGGSFGYVLRGYRSCSESMSFYLTVYLVFVMILFLIIVLFVGFDNLKKMFFEGWGDGL